MALPSYPATLPNPSAWVVVPNDQLRGDEPIDVRKRTSMLTAVAKVQWYMSSAKYAQFVSWWRSDLLFGIRRFTLTIPSAAGWVIHEVRFLSPLKVSAAGFGLSVVDAQVEIYDRKLEVAAPAPAPAPPPPALTISFEGLTTSAYSPIAGAYLSQGVTDISGDLTPVDDVLADNAPLEGGAFCAAGSYGNWPIYGGGAGYGPVVFTVDPVVRPCNTFSYDAVWNGAFYVVVRARPSSGGASSVVVDRDYPSPSGALLWIARANETVGTGLTLGIANMLITSIEFRCQSGAAIDNVRLSLVGTL